MNSMIGKSKNIKVELITGRVIVFWMIFVISCFIGILSSGIDRPQIFQFGPNENLFILDIRVNTIEKYLAVVAFCFLNSFIRGSNNYVLYSWITHNVQDKLPDETASVYESYKLSYIATIYHWFDWFMYMNILLSQIDMLLIEIAGDLIVTTILTAYYLRFKDIPNKKSQQIKSNQRLKSRLTSLRLTKYHFRRVKDIQVSPTSDDSLSPVPVKSEESPNEESCQFNV